MKQLTFQKAAGFLVLVAVAIPLSQASTAQPKKRFAGDWNVTIDYEGREMTSILSLADDEKGKLSGKWISLMGIGELKDLKYEDNKLTFAQVYKLGDNEIKIDFAGKIAKGVLSALTESAIPEKNIDLFRVPGALELPFMAQEIAQKKRYSAIIALGVIVKGKTAHFELVARETGHGLMRVSLDNRMPVLNGIIPALSLTDVKKRSSLTRLKENKGYLTGKSAVQLLQQLQALS